MSADANVTKWSGPEAPTESAIRRLLSSENLQPYQWSNGPGDVYAPHSHLASVIRIPSCSSGRATGSNYRPALPMMQW